MSRKTVSRGSAALALATLLSLASAAPSSAAPRRAEGRRPQSQPGAWSFMLNLTQELVGRYFGFAPSQLKDLSPADRDTSNLGLGTDPNGEHLVVDPLDPEPVLPGIHR